MRFLKFCSALCRRFQNWLGTRRRHPLIILIILINPQSHCIPISSTHNSTLNTTMGNKKSTLAKRKKTMAESTQVKDSSQGECVLKE